MVTLRRQNVPERKCQVLENMCGAPKMSAKKSCESYSFPIKMLKFLPLPPLLGCLAPWWSHGRLFPVGQAGDHLKGLGDGARLVKPQELADVGVDLVTIQSVDSPPVQKDVPQKKIGLHQW